MKRFALILLTVLLWGALAPLFPCDVYLETNPAGGGKNRIQVRLFVELVHRRCPVDIHKSKLETSGMKIEKQGQWQNLDDGLYRLDLVVTLTSEGNGEIRVLRDCPKHGMQKEILGIARF